MDGYTVIIPAFNAAETLQESLESIFRQSLPPQRVILVDDGSTDDTRSIAEAAGVDVRSQQRAGPGAACNLALGEVTTPYVAYLDADDLWLPRKCEDQRAVLAATPEVSGVFGLVRLFKHRSPLAPDAPTREGWGRTTMFFRTVRARAIGPIYDPPGGGRGDLVDWIMRGRELGLRFEMQQAVVAYRRIITGSMSYGRGESDVGYLDVVRRALERKRRIASGGDAA